MKVVLAVLLLVVIAKAVKKVQEKERGCVTETSECADAGGRNGSVGCAGRVGGINAEEKL